MRTTYLVCYDISNDKRRHRVHKALRGFGDHLQYSVFECQLTRADFARCRHILGEAIHHREDQVLFVDLGPVEGRGDRVISALGRAYSPLDSPCFVVEHDDALRRARAVAAAGIIAPPLVDSPKCSGCSLASLPARRDARGDAWRESEADASTQFDLFAPDDAEEPRRVVDEDIRRLVPARDDLRPLYVTGYGFTVGKSHDVLQVKEKGQLVQEIRVREVSQVSVFGSVSLTAGAVQVLCESERPVAHFSMGGWFYGLTQGLGLKNVFLRKDQFRRAEDEAFCLGVAREIVASKIRNQRTLLQRNHVEPPARAIDALRRLARQVIDAGQLDTLLGLEGTAAHYYFSHLSGMLKAEDEAAPLVFDFTTRNRRPPRDPVNALLSFGYSMLARDLTITCHAVGFDPFMGFYHQTPKGRKRFITAYEQRMDALVTHPLFGYRVNYRRVLEIQARLLARVVTGELARYPGFETR